ncbi:prostaglandin D2 synthase b, tandem duplicate 1 [Colossoma macropomum]|uniref:prostaglandin D2 synthase b, tandem duplicate 1 n=1 Tax=Colossoma macropomum TaxID=42526 RepID=UPI001863F1B0|nr:prostaglandin D2 synthase b, tandem duplicate 1 [Colossoma macropomum]XP_036414740.1 prostaglandin D2 synthase b, tandem duplicate 1 [Colossoma macropomum]
MLRFVAFLLCATAACADIMPKIGFKLDEIKGKWYLIGFATDASWFVNHKDGMKMGLALLEPTSDGDLDLTYTKLEDDGSCNKMTHLAKKTETPGKFFFHSKRWGNDNDMRVVDVKPDEFALVHTIKTKGGVSEVLNHLYGRTKDLSAELKKRFQEFSLETGVKRENIVILPLNDVC